VKVVRLEPREDQKVFDECASILRLDNHRVTMIGWRRIIRIRDFSPANGGYTSPVFRIRIAEDGDV
jgi:hypothetical protein